jgi:hypothetical protein
MHTSLARKEFLERALAPEELQGLAVMLADWYGQAVSRRSGTLAVAVRLWGFPRAQGAELYTRLAGRVTAAGLGETARATQTDPDTLAVEGAAFPLQGQLALPNVGGCLAAVLSDPAFEGLWCEARLTLGGARDERDLILAGLVRGGRLWLKAVWPAGRGEFDEELFAHAAWPHEGELLGSLRAYWEGQRVVPAWARQSLFPSAGGRASGGFLAWYLRSSKGSVWPYLLRVGLSVAVIAVCVAGLTHYRQAALIPLWIFWLVLFALGLCFLIVQPLLLVTASRKGMRDMQKAIYSQPVTHRPIDLGTADPVALEDPAIRKLSADIEALGGRHFADIAIDPPISGEHAIRVYLFPEESILFSVLFMRGFGNFRSFPARFTFLLRTAFDDGWRLVSMSGGSGWRRPSPLPVLSRLHDGVADPAEMLERHRASLRKAEGAGRRRAPLDPSRIIESFQSDHDEAAEWAIKSGYFGWADAWRMYFHITLPHYRD